MSCRTCSVFVEANVKEKRREKRMWFRSLCCDLESGPLIKQTVLGTGRDARVQLHHVLVTVAAVMGDCWMIPLTCCHHRHCRTEMRRQPIHPDQEIHADIACTQRKFWNEWEEPCPQWYPCNSAKIHWRTLL
eukprot:scaffold19567_cov61-Attheya_sp.AAC.1